MRTNRFSGVAVAVLAVASGAAWAQEAKPAADKRAATAPATQPVKIDVTTKEGVEGAIDEDAVFTAKVESAQWSSTGRMLLIRFAGTPETFRGTAYQKQREALDKAFNGDFAAAIAGKEIEVTGRVRRYKGTNAEWRDVVEVPITRPGQVKVKD